MIREEESKISEGAGKRRAGRARDLDDADLRRWLSEGKPRDKVGVTPQVVSFVTRRVLTLASLTHICLARSFRQLPAVIIHLRTLL
jgi:hypothetical protein